MDQSYNPFSLVGKTILVTGASSGIGRATAIECSKMGGNGYSFCYPRRERLVARCSGRDGRQWARHCSCGFEVGG